MAIHDTQTLFWYHAHSRLRSHYLSCVEIWVKIVSHRLTVSNVPWFSVGSSLDLSPRQFLCRLILVSSQMISVIWPITVFLARKQWCYQRNFCICFFTQLKLQQVVKIGFKKCCNRKALPEYYFSIQLLRSSCEYLYDNVHLFTPQLCRLQWTK